jgi:hypothetical protein
MRFSVYLYGLVTFIIFRRFVDRRRVRGFKPMFSDPVERDRSEEQERESIRREPKPPKRATDSSANREQHSIVVLSGVTRRSAIGGGHSVLCVRIGRNEYTLDPDAEENGSHETARGRRDEDDVI